MSLKNTLDKRNPTQPTSFEMFCHDQSPDGKKPYSVVSCPYLTTELKQKDGAQQYVWQTAYLHFQIQNY